MITYKNKTFISWQDVVKDYPAMWVVFDKVELKHGQIQSGNIMAILPDEEIISFRNDHLGEVKLSLRTTETVRMNINLDALLAARGVESTAETGVGTAASIIVSGTAGEPIVGVGGYIHGELIDA